jgi:predicted Zn-dependent peptidase
MNYRSGIYIPENMAVVLVGDVTAEEGTAAARRAFAGLEKKTVHRMAIPAEPEHTEQTRLVVKQDTRLSYIGIAFPAPSVKDRPDVHVMDVLMSYLGVGYQSWLTTELKNGKRLAVEASSDFLTQRDRGLAIIMISTEPAKAADAEEAVFAKIEELQSSRISEQDLARAKRSLEGGYAFDMETFSGKATTLGFYAAIDSFEFARTYIQNIRKVTADDVLALAKKYLDPDQSVVVTLGP